MLPFENMSGDPDQEFFADGMAEEIINALSQVNGLRVIARTSAFSFKNTGSDIATIGAKLNASVVVEGSVRKFGDRVRITAQLIDVAGGHHLWSERYDRGLDNIFEIQDEIAATIVRTIRPKLLGGSDAPLVARATESQEAYELYLRASDRLTRFDRWDTRTAIALLRDATDLDPKFADAWGRPGHACCQMNFSFDPHERWHQSADEAIDRAFKLDPTNAEASYAKGLLLWNPRAGFRHAKALRALRQALERLSLGHFHHTQYFAAAALASLGQTGEAIANLKRAAVNGFPNYPLFRDDPLLASLQGEPEMVHLLSDLEREWRTYNVEFGPG